MAHKSLLAVLFLVGSVSSQVIVVPPGATLGPQLGTRVLSLHDIDGDGVRDYIATAPASQPFFAQVFNSGQLIAYSGSDDTQIWATTLVNDGNNRGRGLGLGDWDGDGVDEVISIRQWTYLLGVAPSIDIHDAATGNLLASRTLPAYLPWSSVGDRIVAIDLNADGKEELVVSAGVPTTAQSSGSGAVVILDSTSTTLLDISDSSEIDFGRGVYLTGDLDFDGLRDLVITAPHATHASPVGPLLDAGLIRVVSSITHATLYELRGNEADQELGRWLLPLGDFNSDGFEDLGYIRKSTWSGSTTYDIEVLQSAVYTIVSRPLPADFVPGELMKRIADVDGDGQDDIAISGFFPGIGLEGLLLIAYDDLRPLDRIHGDPILSDFGHDFAVLPDGNGDGRFDLAIGEPMFNGGLGRLSRRSVPAALSALADGSSAHDLLTVNGSVHLPSRRVDLAIGEAFTIEVDADGTTGQPTDFILWGLIGVPDQGSTYSVAGATFLFPPRIAAPNLPWLFTLSDSIGFDPAAAFPGYQAPWAIGAPFGIAFPVDLCFQGVTISGGNVEVTNGVLLSVR